MFAAVDAGASDCVFGVGGASRVFAGAISLHLGAVKGSLSPILRRYRKITLREAIYV